MDRIELNFGRGIRFIVVMILASSIISLLFRCAGVMDLPALSQWESNLIGIGVWAVAFAIAAVDASQQARRLERPKQGVCPACGYDLRGSVSNVCSECGQPIPADDLETFNNDARP